MNVKGELNWQRMLLLSLSPSVYLSVCLSLSLSLSLYLSLPLSCTVESRHIMSWGLFYSFFAWRMQMDVSTPICSVLTLPKGS